MKSPYKESIYAQQEIYLEDWPEPFKVFTEGGFYDINVESLIPSSTVFDIVTSEQDYIQMVDEYIQLYLNKEDYFLDVIVIKYDETINIYITKPLKISIKYSSAEVLPPVPSDARNMILQFMDFINLEYSNY